MEWMKLAFTRQTRLGEGDLRFLPVVRASTVGGHCNLFCRMPLLCFKHQSSPVQRIAAQPDKGRSLFFFGLKPTPPLAPVAGANVALIQVSPKCALSFCARFKKKNTFSRSRLTVPVFLKTLLTLRSFPLFELPP